MVCGFSYNRGIDEYITDEKNVLCDMTFSFFKRDVTSGVYVIISKSFTTSAKSILPFLLKSNAEMG